MDKRSLASYLDLANHEQKSAEEDIKKLCGQVRQYHFHSAFVNPYYVALAKKIIKNRAAVGTVISFPLGQEGLDVKVFSSLWAVKQGADELDIANNVGFFKMGRFEKAKEEMKTIVKEVKKKRKQTIIKFIIETGHLSEAEIKKAAVAILTSGADFIKICSGMGPRGASLEDVKLIRSIVGQKIKLKAAGGISTYKQAADFIAAGVDRMGSSHAVEIVLEKSLKSLSGKSE